MTPLARHCALVAAGPSHWWQDKPVGTYYARRVRAYRDVLSDYIATVPVGQPFTASDVCKVNPELSQKLVRDYLRADATLERVSYGTYARRA